MIQWWKAKEIVVANTEREKSSMKFSFKLSVPFFREREIFVLQVFLFCNKVISIEFKYFTFYFLLRSLFVKPVRFKIRLSIRVRDYDCRCLRDVVE